MMDAPPPVETVVVRSARLPDSPADAAFSVIRLDPEAVRVAPRLDDALTASPGVGLFRRTSSAGANPTTQGVSLREIAPSGAGRALVTLDGAPQNDPFGGWVIWSALPPEGLGGVSLVRGAGAGPYGAGALTGVVDLTSLEGDHTVASIEGGDLGHARAAAAVSRVSGRFSGLVTLGRERNDGWTPVRAGRGAADEDLSLDASTGSARLQFDAGAAVIAGRVAAYREERSAGLVGARSIASGTSASLTAAQARADGGGWRAQGWVAKSDLANSSVAVAAGRTGTTPANDQYETPATGYGLNAAWRGADGLWEVGADLRATEGESRERFRFMAGAFTRSREAGGRTLTYGIYGEAHRRSGPWLVTGGVRVDRWSTSEGLRLERDLTNGAITLNNPSRDRDGVVPTARAGVRRDFGGVYGRTAAYAGFRPPTLNELHRPFRVGNDITEANPGLEPERLYGVEAAIGQDDAWSVTAFFNRLKDPVTNVTIGAGPGTFPVAGFVPAGGVLRQRQNAGQIDAFGIEAEGRVALGPVTVHGAFTFTEAEVDGGAVAPQLTGLRPAQAPRVAATLQADWRVADRLTLAADVRYEGERFDDDINSRRLAPATTVSARAEFAVAEGALVYLAGDNLLDADVATGRTADGVTSYGPPRAIRVGLRLNR